MRTWYRDHLSTGLAFEAAYQRRKEETILISVGVITRERPELLRNALMCVLPQMTLETEIVVVVDGHDPDTIDVLRELRHPALRAVVLHENQGRPRARNVAVKAARGEYMLWVDDDDLPLPNIVSTYKKLIERRPEVDVAYCDLELFDPSSGLPLRLISAPDVSGHSAKLLQELIAGRGVNFPGSLIRRSLILSLGGFDERFARAQDYELWFRLARVARFHKVPLVLYRYCRNPMGASFGPDRDYSFACVAIRSCLQRVPLEEVFPELGWHHPGPALAQALHSVSRNMLIQGDVYTAERYAAGVPFECLTAEVLQLRVNLMLLLDRPLNAIGLLSSARSNFPDMGEGVFRECYTRIREYEQLSLQLRRDMEDTNASKRSLRLLHHQFPHSLLSAWGTALHFDRLDDSERATRYMRRALRLRPESSEVYQWLRERHDTTAAGIRSRMLGEYSGAPLFFLKSLVPPGHYRIIERALPNFSRLQTT